MYILGINAFHGDSSASLYRDGVLVCAAEEERFRRIKHWAGLPSEAIRFCLGEAGIRLAELDHICFGRDPAANRLRKIAHVVRHGTPWSVITSRIKNQNKFKSLPLQLAEAFGESETSIRAKIHSIEHHRSHLASAFFASPFRESALLSIDGFGDFSSTMLGVGLDNDIRVLEQVYYPHSIGAFYTAFTQYLGFPHYGDEYKVMGLAPYGQPSLIDKVAEVIQIRPSDTFRLNQKYFRHFREGVQMTWEGGSPEIGPMWSSAFESLFGKARQAHEPIQDFHRDLAASVQRHCEKVIFHLLNRLHRLTGIRNLCLAGGVAQNSVANGKIARETPFENVYLPPAGHDAGTALGAALWVQHQELKLPRQPAMLNPFTGYQAKDSEIESLLRTKGLPIQRLDDPELFSRVVDCLISGGVVGWYQGRAELGPRALGHRSILADPRRSDVKEILNLKIKRRESFRPFAPSILKEAVKEYFLETADVPFMEKVFRIRPEKQSAIPAVTHVDGTGRLQSVDATIDPRYHALISVFAKKSGVPILVNTSFNENEPIVNRPEEALECFLRTKMDLLVLNRYLLERPKA